MKAQWLNGWTREKFLKQIELMNGFELCTNGPNCYYRHPETGKACFVGVFIPDDKYSIAFEGKSFEIGLFNEIDFPLEPQFMGDLQEIHDTFLFPRLFETIFNTNNLKQAVINYLDKHGLD